LNGNKKQAQHLILSDFMKVFFSCIALFLLALTANAQDYQLSKKDTSDIRFINTRKFYFYKVDKGETLYSIQKKFNVTEADLLEFNPDLKDGLKNKMKLWIPASVVKKEVPPVKEKEADVHPRDAFLNVSLLMPFRIGHNYVTGDLLNDSLLLTEGLDKETSASLEFYEGMLYAIDELAKTKNLKIKLHVYDTQDDTLITAKVLSNAGLQLSEVLIAGGNSGVLKLINQYSRMHKIPLLSSAMNSSDQLKDNPDAIALLPSSLTQCHQMGKACADLFKGAQCLLATSSVPKENERSKAFKAGWLEESKGNTVKEMSLAKGYSTKDFDNILRDSLSATKHNVIFIPSSNEDLVSTLLISLESVPAEKKVALAGIPTWQYFETVDPALMEKMNTYIFVTSNIDFDNDAALEYRKYFRDTYSSEPSDHAYQGYDAMQLLGNAWLHSSKSFMEKIQKENYQGLYTNYRFVTTGGFHENDFIYVLHYKNLDLERVDSIIK
jgi:ABC-type branched-subunit amino acid transport system substrate-binding protein